jgi:hypothetical protein
VHGFQGVFSSKPRVFLRVFLRFAYPFSRTVYSFTGFFVSVYSVLYADARCDSAELKRSFTVQTRNRIGAVPVLPPEQCFVKTALLL